VVFSEFDTGSKFHGSLDADKFKKLLEKFEITVEDDNKLLKLMEIIDPRGTNYSRQGYPRVHMAAIENRMGRYGIGIKKGTNGERVSFRDIPLARLVTTLNEKLKRVITVEEYFRIYD
jgi:hypothetical protein